MLSFPHSVSCNFPSILPHKTLIPKPPLTLISKTIYPKTNLTLIPTLNVSRRSHLHIPQSTADNNDSEAPLPKISDGRQKDDWTTSILLFGFWVAVMAYVILLSPNQTPVRDSYFLQKLLNLKGDDGFEMNEVLVALWYIMGLWPLVYSMLLIPTGRSSRSIVPVWPFLVLSCFGGAYALIPYFVLWRPPPPPVGEDEITSWPLRFLESKITAGVLLAVGSGLILYAGLAGSDVWAEFYQYFRESKFIHATSIDFSLLSTFAPFWVYNDMTARRSSEKSYWLLPVALVPFLGPSLYLLLRPPLSGLPMSPSSDISETETETD